MKYITVTDGKNKVTIFLPHIQAVIKTTKGSRIVLSSGFAVETDLSYIDVLYELSKATKLTS